MTPTQRHQFIESQIAGHSIRPSQQTRPSFWIKRLQLMGSTLRETSWRKSMPVGHKLYLRAKMPVACACHLLSDTDRNSSTTVTNLTCEIMPKQRTCSITSGAIQHGVPTKVLATFRRLPYPTSHPATPKSASLTRPSSPRRILPALMSRWICRFVINWQQTGRDTDKPEKQERPIA